MKRITAFFREIEDGGASLDMLLSEPKLSVSLQLRMPKITPFILLERKQLPPESPPSEQHVYDQNQQIWVDTLSGMPLVSCLQAHSEPTKYGETTFTETREGVDQTEGAGYLSSRFGETTMTKTGESADQESTFEASRFGETTHTVTREGVDQTEGAALLGSQFGETTVTRTREGADQIEGTQLEASRFGETTLTKTQEGADQTEGAAPRIYDAAHPHL